jgi:hypothetical protein
MCEDDGFDNDPITVLVYLNEAVRAFLVANVCPLTVGILLLIHRGTHGICGSNRP